MQAKPREPAANPLPEDPRPSLLRPEVMPTAEHVAVEPRLREQALPEKHDHRFFDRWALDWAQELGERAVKREMLVKLGEAIRAFAKWRGLGHRVAAEQESVKDRQTVASTEATVERATDEATRHKANAEAEERKASEYDREARAAAAERSELPPALRGAAHDVLILIGVNFVLFVVDLLVLRLGLGLTPGKPGEHWVTAAAMGAGAVLVADALGLLGALGTIHRDNTFKRPSWPVIGVGAVLLILTVWFFASLGDFRGESIQRLAEKSGARIADPRFFTLAQITFFLGSAFWCFAYFARWNGRELLARQRKAEAKRDAHLTEAKALRGKAEQAMQRAAEARINSAKADARIESRTKIAAAAADRDNQQGDYLVPLTEPKYANARTPVETGVHYWYTDQSTTSRALYAIRLARPGRAGGAALLAAVVAFATTGNVVVAALAGIAVGVAMLFAARPRSASEASETTQRRLAFRADVAAASRVSDIDGLVPLFQSNGKHRTIEPDELRTVVDHE